MSERIIAKAWADVGKTDLVEIGDTRYHVLKVKPVDGGKVKVTIRDPETGDEFSSKMDAKAGVDIVQLVKRKTKDWSIPDTEAEERIVEHLDGELLGVRPTEHEAYIVPLVTIDTMAAHLYIFHGIEAFDVRAEGGWDKAVEVHKAEHLKKVSELHTPHYHEADRPVVGKGPRFN